MDGGQSTHTLRLAVTSSALVFAVNGVGLSSISSSSLPNRWAHVALVRSSGVVTPYLDGTPGTSLQPAAYDNNVVTNGKVYFGQSVSNQAVKGNVDEFRLSVGVARYSGSFTPPTTKFTPRPRVFPSPATEGQVVYDEDALYFCVAGGSPGTWKILTSS